VVDLVATLVDSLVGVVDTDRDDQNVVHLVDLRDYALVGTVQDYLEALVGFHNRDTGLLANNFLVNTEIVVEGKDPSYSHHAVVACEAMVDQDSLALAAVPDLSFVPLTVHPDLSPDLTVAAVDPVLAEFLVVNDYLKVLEALANFVL
jgi:hypothetical protein